MAQSEWKKRVGKYGVPCMVSSRWLQFPEKSAGHFGGGEFIDVDVMTEGENEKPRRICHLVVTREDLLRVINSVKEGGK